MRELESILILANLAAIALGIALPSEARSSRFAVSASLLFVALVQLAFEGYRWQMLSAYFAVLLTFVIFVCPEVQCFRIGKVVVVAALILSSVAITVYPVFQLPPPSGTYSIGTLTYHLIDPDRREAYGPQPGGPRELMIQIWYPASAGSLHAPERYSDPALATIEFSYLKYVNTHTFQGIPAANVASGFPVILFTPSWHGLRSQETAVVEELVSNGFVVVGVDHPYGSRAIVFPDGRKIWARPVNFMNTSSETTTRESFKTADQEVRLRALDLVFALNQIEKINQHDRLGVLTGHLDPTRVGILGYSFGGAVAVETCSLDRRFRCAVDLDGALFGQSAVEGIVQPLLVMTDSARPPTEGELNSPRAAERRYAAFLKEQVRLLWQDMKMHGGYVMEIDGIAHANFSDAGFQSPIRWVTGGGIIGQSRATTIIRAYTLAFFEEFLNRDPQPLLAGPSQDFPEVRLEVSQGNHGSNH
jgi:dienelactone hydrolase